MSNARPYSLRDLRAGLVTEEMRRDFGGDYDYQSRRWRFASRDAAAEARDRVARLPLITMHEPSISNHGDIVQSRGGFSIVARGDDEQNRRGTGFFIFRSEDDRYQAERAVFSRTRATGEAVANATAAITGAGKAGVPLAPTLAAAVDAWTVREPSREEVRSAHARALAAISLTPPTKKINDESIAEVVRAAQTFTPSFRATETRDSGFFVGLLAGRSTYHLAIQTHEDGSGIVVPRAGIAFPLPQGKLEPREVQAQTWSAIGVQLHDGFGKAMQLPRGKIGHPDARDFGLGGLRVRAMFAADERGLLPILQHDELENGEDYDTELVALDDTYGVGLDCAAYATIGYARDLAGNAGDRIRRGPSFTEQRTLTARR
jgi:hypothetical protein